MRKRIWTIVLSSLLFLSAAVLGFATIYRVDTVTVQATIVSEGARAEADAFRQRLESVYRKDGTVFADEAKAQEVVKEFPYFRITAFEKAYPDRLIVSVQEDEEVYAVENADGNYYILGSDGTLLGVRGTHTNTLNGAENVILKGLSVSGKKGEKLSGDECLQPMLSLCAAFSENLGGIRRNVAWVSVYRRATETIFCIAMREGVKIYIGAPATNTQKKARLAVDKYLSLTEAEKLCGMIMVSELGGEEIVKYYEKDVFQE